MQKAAEDMKKKQAEEAEAKRQRIEKLVGPLKIDGLGKCKSLPHNRSNTDSVHSLANAVI